MVIGVGLRPQAKEKIVKSKMSKDQYERYLRDTVEKWPKLKPDTALRAGKRDAHGRQA
jgi:hypothetical protein